MCGSVTPCLRGPSLVIASAVLAAASISAQDRPTFRSNVRLVNVNVIAHDSSGRPVRNLTASDFRIYEDGKEQTLEVFAIEAAPMAPTVRAAGSAATAASPNVFSNRLAERPPGGVTVILFDRLNSGLEDQKQARDQILKMLAAGRTGDRVALYVLESDVVNVLHDFTSDAGRLVAVLNRYFGNTSIELARSDEAVPTFAPTGFTAEDAETRAWLERTMLMVSESYLRRRAELTTTALEGIANHLAGIPGRKNLVWVSGAFPFVIPTAHGPQVMNTQVNRATRAINSADVAVYPVDIRGLMGAFVNPTASTATVQRGAPPSGSGLFTTMATTHPQQDTMREIAAATGGRVYINTNAIGEAVSKALEDSRVSYVLGYYSSRPDGDNKFRNISVKVNRGGIELRHRKGYLPAAVAPRNATARIAALARVLRSPLEASSIALTAEISRMGKEGTVVVRIDPGSLTWAQQAGLRAAVMDVVIAQSAPDGKYFTIRETTVNLTADPDRYRQMEEDGLTLSSNFTLVPAAYRLHVVVSDVASQSVGSLIIPIKN
jgi:VWFA-related protein